MKTNLTITAAGKAALIAAGSAGPDAVEITGITVGLAPRVLPDITGVTALQSEITRTDFRGDAGASPGSIAGYGLFEGDDAWTALEVGVYATVGDADEILFAYALAAANTAGVRVPLLTKTAGEDARYDFAFIFSPSSDAATPCAAPAPPPCFAPSPCFTPPYYYAPPPVPLPVPPPPLKQRVWLSVNTRQPYDDDIAHPVGHIWRWGKNEWQLESITDGEAQWRQTKGSVLLFERNPAIQLRDHGVAENFTVTLGQSMAEFSQLMVVARCHGLLYNSPAFILTDTFMGGEVVNLLRADGSSPIYARLSYSSDSEVIISSNRRHELNIHAIYGVY